MLECPRRDCSKQYKHDEGLRWHLSHSHPEFIDSNGDIKDAAQVEKEEQERRRRARLLKEERRQKENRAASDNGEKPPSKAAKLDLDKACGSPKSSSKPSTPTSSKPGTPQLPPAPLAAKLTPASSQPPPVSSRLPGQLPAGLIAPNMKTSVAGGGPGGPVKPAEVTPLLEDLNKHPEAPRERLPPLDPEKPPVNSPAYSDISDDGEPEAAVTKAPAPPPPGAKQLPPKSSSLTPFGLPLAPDPLVTGLPTSLPLTRPGSVPPPADLRASTPSSLASPSQRPVFSSPSVGPSPGTPEYHKYLAANGFPPFPYPYPVGMDPNYHVQLLKTDPIYKAKWEKDRAERERAFKEELDKDQGRYSGLSLLKDDHPKTGASSLPSTPVRPPVQSQSSSRLPEDLRKREPSGDRSKSSPSPVISVKAEFREREGGVKKEAVKTEEGVKPTMETRGPPPGPQTFGYMHPGLVRPPFSLGLHPPFDPMLTTSLAPFGLPGAGPNPYLSSIRPPPGAFSFPGDPLRSPFPSLPSPEDLMRSGAGLPGLPGAPPGLSGTKALDLLQQHASQYYANQKLAELQERALKSPAHSMSSISSHPPGPPPVSKAITTMAGKQSPSPVSSASSDKSKSPPPLRHVHTHTHTHIGLGYPLLPPVPGALPPVPGGLPPGALPPPSVGVVPASFTAGKNGENTLFKFLFCECLLLPLQTSTGFI